MATREILTLQFGHYSNFVGTHWWNVQEFGFEYNADKPSEINHDVLFREGLTCKGETTFTPRALIVDLNGSLNALPIEGDLYEPTLDPAQVESTWKENTDIKVEPKAVLNEFQTKLYNSNSDSSGIISCDSQFDTNIKVWSDYLYTRFHPRSVNIVKEYSHTDHCFDVYPIGYDLWKHESFQERFTDKIRNYIEECHSLQGFQILLDSTDAFAGLGIASLEYLIDEYSSKPTLVLPLIPSCYADYQSVSAEEKCKSLIKDSLRVLNLGFCYTSLIEHGSMFVPLCTSQNGWRQPGPKRDFNHIYYNEESWYHTSAILASALDTFTLKYRLRDTNYSLHDLVADLTLHQRKAVSASVCLPFCFNRGADLIDCLNDWDGALTQSITPNCKIGDAHLIQHLTLRGVCPEHLKRPSPCNSSQAHRQKQMPAYACRNVEEMLSMYASYITHNSCSQITSTSNPLHVNTPYPHIFDDRIGINGNIVDTRSKDTNVESIPVLAGLHCDSEIGKMVKSLYDEVKRIKFDRFYQFINVGMGKDEYNECLNKLLDFKERYEESYLI